MHCPGQLNDWAHRDRTDVHQHLTLRPKLVSVRRRPVRIVLAALVRRKRLTQFGIHGMLNQGHGFPVQQFDQRIRVPRWCLKGHSGVLFNGCCTVITAAQCLPKPNSSEYVSFFNFRPYTTFDCTSCHNDEHRRSRIEFATLAQWHVDEDATIQVERQVLYSARQQGYPESRLSDTTLNWQPVSVVTLNPGRTEDQLKVRAVVQKLA